MIDFDGRLTPPGGHDYLNTMFSGKALNGRTDRRCRRGYVSGRCVALPLALPGSCPSIWMQIAGELIPETDNYPGLSLVNNVSFEECIFVRESGGYTAR